MEIADAILTQYFPTGSEAVQEGEREDLRVWWCCIFQAQQPSWNLLKLSFTASGSKESKGSNACRTTKDVKRGAELITDYGSEYWEDWRNLDSGWQKIWKTEKGHWKMSWNMRMDIPHLRGATLCTWAWDMCVFSLPGLRRLLMWLSHVEPKPW